MVTVAESSLKTSKNCRADEKIAWAEMLNSATEKVNSAEKERLAAFEEHTQRLGKFQQCERTMTHLQKSLKRHIINSKPYFELKSNRMKDVDEKRDGLRRSVYGGRNSQYKELLERRSFSELN